jgi:hypothetical protein
MSFARSSLGAPVAGAANNDFGFAGAFGSYPHRGTAQRHHWRRVWTCLATWLRPGRAPRSSPSPARTVRQRDDRKLCFRHLVHRKEGVRHNHEGVGVRPTSPPSPSAPATCSVCPFLLPQAGLGSRRTAGRREADGRHHGGRRDHGCDGDHWRRSRHLHAERHSGRLQVVPAGRGCPDATDIGNGSHAG